MSRILLFLEQTENRRLLAEWLGTHYQVLLGDSVVQSGQAVPLLEEPFDLCILDGVALDHLWEWVQVRKKAEQPVFLPFLLITPCSDVKMITRHLWQSVDELITKPIEKLELQARVEILLRSRQFSLQLKSANEQLHHEVIQRQRAEVEREKALGELQKAEAEIRYALQQEKELNELKSRFVSMVSHEFRNPLNAISASAQLLERFGDKWDKEKQSDFFRRIKGSVSRMTELLDDVLFLGKAGAGKLQFNPASVDLENLCRNLVEELKLSTGNKHAIAFTIQGKCTTVDMDENLLQYILSNLLSNAIKYSPAGSTVQFEIFCQDEAVIFQVQDQGIGIPAEDLGNLFTSFHRAKNVGSIPGTGLGLAIVKQCVDLHGGAIAVASEVGVGTTFTVTLPFKICQENLTVALNQKSR